MRLRMNPSISFFTTIGTWPTLSNIARARSIVSGDVKGAPESSTIGTTCGGLTGWATRQRWRPCSSSAKREVTMNEDDEARMASGAARLIQPGEQIALHLDPFRPALLHQLRHPAPPLPATPRP